MDLMKVKKNLYLCTESFIKKIIIAVITSVPSFKFVCAIFYVLHFFIIFSASIRL